MVKALGGGYLAFSSFSLVYGVTSVGTGGKTLLSTGVSLLLYFL